MPELVMYIVGFVVLSGAMAIVEASIFAITVAEVDEANAQRKIGAAALKKVVGQLTRAVVVLVVFTNVVNILGPILIGRKAIELYGDRSIPTVTVVLVVATIIFSEVIPKSLGSHYAPIVSRVAAPAIHTLSYVFYPLVIALERLSALLKSGTRELGTEAQIRSLVSRGRKAGLIEHDEGQMIRRAFVLNDRTASDIMTPLSKIVGMQRNDTLADASETVLQHAYSRYPLFGSTSNDVCGIVLGRDILGLQVRQRESACLGGNLDSIALPCPIVGPDALTDSLLERFRAEQVHMGIVQDNGVTIGLVTLEDTLEQLVGHIEDEKDTSTINPMSGSRHWG